MLYNWQLDDWPFFTYNFEAIEGLLYEYSQKSGRIAGALGALDEAVKNDTIVDFMVTEAIKTSEIEGEYMSRQDVVSSIKRNLGFSDSILQVRDLRARGIAELMIDVRDGFQLPLSVARLHRWHEMLMKGNKSIEKGVWRSGHEPMQVISGSIGKEQVHFEAPPSSVVSSEMDQFINWFNESKPNTPKGAFRSPLRSAIAHLYFESIHPYEDGNGRIGRAISEKALSQGLSSPAILSLSRVIESNKNDYYSALKAAQRSNEITSWLEYFLRIINKAQDQASEKVDFILKKTKFFDQHKAKLNARQTKVIARMLEEGVEGFEGGMNAKKYMSITGASKATATRDLQDLNRKGIFLTIGGGRSTRYAIHFDNV